MIYFQTGNQTIPSLPEGECTFGDFKSVAPALGGGDSLLTSDNLRLLGETIGIELEQEAQEKALGPFSVATPAQLAEEVPRVLLRLPT